MATFPDTLIRDQKLRSRPLGPQTIFDNSGPRTTFDFEKPGPKNAVTDKLGPQEVIADTPATKEKTAETAIEAPLIPPPETFQDYVFRPARSRLLRYELLGVYGLILAGSLLVTYFVRDMRAIQTADTHRDVAIRQLRTNMQGSLNRNGQALSILDRIGARITGIEGDVSNLRSGLATGLASSSLREARIESELKRLDARISDQARVVQGLSARPSAPAPAAAPAVAAPAPVVFRPAPEATAPSAAASSSAVGAEAHKHEYRTDINVPSGADVRVLGHGGVAWLLSVEGENATQVVRPFGQTKAGIQVHNQNNNRDYLITPNGWITIN